MKAKRDDDLDLDFLTTLSDEELRELFEAQQELEHRLATSGPQTDDELHAWLIDELGIDVPRVSVCEDHQAPFDFLADLFFERTEAALLMANRGGSKTFLVAVLHWLNSRFKPGCESATFGATEAQSLRAYAHLKSWIYDENGNPRPEVSGSLMRETMFKNGSKIEVLAGTPEAVNGPHPQKAHADEIELMREDTWRESRNMTVSKRIKVGIDDATGEPIFMTLKPQDIATSTRKGPNGRMQKLIDEIEEAISQGFKPPRKLYAWCIKETAAQVTNCRSAPENADLPDDQLCECNTIKSGEYDDGTPRLLVHICDGDFYRSRGWQPYGDVVKQFTENDPDTFSVQQLCSKPEMKHHYLPNYNEQTHGIKGDMVVMDHTGKALAGYDADPDNGPIYLSVDWGGTNPHAVNWYQRLDFEIDVLDRQRNPKRLPEGSIIVFDEIYVSEIGNTALGELVIAREAQYKRYWAERGKDWKTEERFADPQGKAAKLDWRTLGLRTKWHTTREFEEHVKAVKEIQFFVDLTRCKMFNAEAKAWRRDEKTGNQLDEFNHCMSNFRYAVANIKRLKRRRGTGNASPQSKPLRRQAPRPRPGPVRYVGGRPTSMDNWRRGLGSPVTRRTTP
jgi:hypothetical protein